MNLQKTNTGIVKVEFRSLAEQRFESPSIKQLTLTLEGENDLKKEILQSITQTYFLCGQEIDNNTLKAVFSLFYEEIKQYWYLTISEIKRCFKSGYKKEFGDYYGLSVKTFILWIEYYVNNVRDEELSKRRKNKNENSMTESEKYILVKSGMKKCIDYYEKYNAILEGYTMFLYDVLLEDKLINLSVNEKQEWYKDAKEVLIYEMITNKPKTLSERDYLKTFKRNIEKKNSSEVVFKAKEMIVMDYFRRTYNDPKSLIYFKSKYA